MEAAAIRWRPLGELLIERGLITPEELKRALEEQVTSGKRLGEILVAMGLVSGPELTDVLMEQVGVELTKENGFGSGLWSAIKQRHPRAQERFGPAADPGAEPSAQENGDPEPTPAILEGAVDEAEAGGFQSPPLFEDPEPPVQTELEAELEAELAAERAAADEIRTELATLRAAVAAHEERERDVPATAEAHEREVAALEADLETLRFSLTSREEREREFAAAAESRERRVADLEAELAEAREELARRAEAIAALHESAAAGQEDDLDALRASLASHEERERELLAAVESHERHAAGLEKEVVEAQEELARRAQVVAALEADARDRESLGERLAAVEAEAAGARAAADALEEALAGARDELDRSEAAWAGEREALVRAREEVMARLEEFEELDRQAEAAARSEAEERLRLGHVLFCVGPDGYTILPREGLVPAVGDELAFDDCSFVVMKVGRSPFPVDRRPCAYLERLYLEPAAVG